MHETVDAAGKPDEYAEVGDRFDLAAHLVAAVVVLGEILPRIGLALLDAQADAAALFVDVEDHDFDFLTDVHELGRAYGLVGPIHFRHVHQPLDALFDFHEAAVVGDVGDLAEQSRVGRIAPRNVLPRIRAELLQAQRYALPFTIEFEDTDVDLFADLDHLGRMLDALSRHVGDVQQAVDAAQIDERAVIGEGLDHSLDGRALLEIVEK